VWQGQEDNGRGAGARKGGDTGADESGTEKRKELGIRGETRSDGENKKERPKRDQAKTNARIN
jgi:hypothetical protein